MQELKISIIIPSFNQGAYLEECILSILSQNYPAFEIIIIDGGSTDQSVNIIKKYESKIKYWISEKDRGQSHAINKGLKRSSGEIVSWLGSDDMYLPGALEKANKTFQAETQSIGLIYGTSELFNHSGNIRIETAPDEMSMERMFSGMSFPQPSSFFRRSLLQEAGFLNEELHFGMDYELFSRFRISCEFAKVDFCFSRYRIHDQSKTITSTSKFTDDWILIFNSICEGFELVHILNSLDKLQLRIAGKTEIKEFFSRFSIKNNINEERLFFYFLSNVLRYDYESSRFKRARTIANELKSVYPSFLSSDLPLKLIVNRARRVPPSILRLARRFSRK